jgi:hypothetical protein
MQPDVKIAMTIHPEVSHEIMEKTFEGALLAHMLVPIRTASGYELVGPNGVSPVVVGLGDLLAKALESNGSLAEKMVPVINAALQADEVHYDPSITLDEISDALGESFDVTTVLQEVCRLHPAQIPYFQVLWSTFVEGHERRLAQHGMLSGGADLITATGVNSLNARDWLDDQTEAALRVQAASKRNEDWNFTGTNESDGFWHLSLPATDIKKILADDPVDELHIRCDGNGEYDLFRWMASEGVGRFVAVRDTLDAAMRSGEERLAIAEAECSEALCKSMGLSFEEWSIDWDNGMPYAINRSEPELHIVYDGDGFWGLYMDEDERSQSDRPSVLADMVRDVHREVFPNEP